MSRTQLDEFDGDILPPPTSFRADIERYGEDDLRDGDLLVVHDHLADGTEASLVSVFGALDHDRLVTRAYAVALDRLTGPTDPGQYYRFQGGAFEALDLDEVSIGPARQRHMARARARRMARLPENPGRSADQP